jgi:hypothetical protein
MRTKGSCRTIHHRTARRDTTLAVFVLDERRVMTNDAVERVLQTPMRERKG